MNHSSGCNPRSVPSKPTFTQPTTLLPYHLQIRFIQHHHPFTMGTKKKVSHGGKKSRAQNEKTPTADRNEPSTFEILCTLANDMREQECYLQAVKFLEAASTIPDAIPVQRAVACLSLATIVLDRFDNVDYAKERLLQAVCPMKTAFVR